MSRLSFVLKDLHKVLNVIYGWIVDVAQGLHCLYAQNIGLNIKQTCCLVCGKFLLKKSP